MASDPGTLAAQGARAKGSTAWRVFRLLLIGALVSVALLVAFPPTGLIKDQIAKSVGQSIGRTITIGDMRLRLRPKLDVEFDQVAVSNPVGMPARDVLRVETIKTRVDLLPLLKGRVRMDSLDLVKPEIALEEDATGTRNWVFGTQPAPVAAGAAPAEAPAATPAAFNLPPVTNVTDGSLTFQSAKTGAKRAASKINSVHTLDLISGAMASKGNLSAGGETVVFDVALSDFDAMLAGNSSRLIASMDARPLKASVEGDAVFSALAEFKGDVTASSPSLMDLAYWLGSDAAPSGEPLRSSLEGKIAATTQDVTFTETDVMVNTTSGRVDGKLDLGGDRPKFAGTISSEHIDLGRISGSSQRAALAPSPQEDFEPLITPSWDQLLKDLDTLEKGPAAAAQAEPSAAPTAAATSGWSEQPFNLKALRSFDLDVILNAATITYGALDLKQGRVKATIADGTLDANIEELSVADGKAVGTVTIDSKASPPRAAVALTLTDVAAEPVVTELTGKPLLSGKSNVEITATAAGQNQAQLTSTLDGKARFRMAQGALRGFDVRRMIFEWWKSWKFDLAMKTGFERLDAQYDIKKGIMRSQPGFEMGGSEVEINSAGTVNVPNKRLNQEIRVKAIPPPTAFPIPIRISGDWAKPSIGIDWGGLFSAAPGLGGPQALAASPEAAPANVQAAIRRVLSADLPPDRLSPEARQMLESLLPTDATP
ncbi:AsmA family protein [Hyphomicrobium sp.]|uniref:AsmA family protein n=1 Tax=Hyphomicrobium sp. TaxID=82 RepID=UPI002E31B6F3|nr:AsmA family protein [Hyphomicrobium sp.]HEX2839889.1 AsmA family protein [Hyphomicrobium sp.]